MAGARGSKRQMVVWMIVSVVRNLCNTGSAGDEGPNARCSFGLRLLAEKRAVAPDQPTGRANARPMINSAKSGADSRVPDCGSLSGLRLLPRYPVRSKAPLSRPRIESGADSLPTASGGKGGRRPRYREHDGTIFVKVGLIDCECLYQRQSPQGSSMQTGYDLTRHLVPVNGAFVFGANPTDPSWVLPSSHRGPSIEPRHLRLTSSGPTSTTSHLVPENGGLRLGANPTVPVAVLPSSHRGPLMLPRHSNPTVPSPFSTTVHFVPVRLLMHILSTKPTVPSWVLPSTILTPGLSPKHSSATSRWFESICDQLRVGAKRATEPPAKIRMNCRRVMCASSGGHSQQAERKHRSGAPSCIHVNRITRRGISLEFNSGARFPWNSDTHAAHSVPDFLPSRSAFGSPRVRPSIAFIKAARSLPVSCRAVRSNRSP
jgi:hypothetical protein